jgi:protein-tyrosine kinase
LTFQSSPEPQPPGGALIPRMSSAPTVAVDPEILSAHKIYGFDSRDLKSRPFNLLRSRLLKIAAAKQWRLIGITSPAPGAGKSFVAANLAAAMSRTPDIEVYLFDLDLRRSSVAKTFGLPKSVGLDRYLRGEASHLGTIPQLAQVAKRIEGQRLMVLPSFPSSAPSAELLAGKPMKRLIAAMRALPDNAICLCDLPPVFANDDAALVTEQLDAYLLVVEEGITTRKQIRDSVGLLMPTPCAGTILNRYYGGLISDDYGYGYKHNTQYGDYYNPEAPVES